MTEAVTAIVRAGAGIVITYAAADLADMAPGRAMSDDAMSDQIYIQALGLGLDPAWRRLSRRRAARRRLPTSGRPTRDVDRDGVRTLSYSSIGLEPGVDILLWRMAAEHGGPRDVGRAAPSRAGLGRWLTRHATRSSAGSGRRSTSASRPSRSSRCSPASARAYLVVYPFTKSTDWYLLGKEARQGVMNEHMRVGHDYPTVRQALAYSFGLD